MIDWKTSLTEIFLYSEETPLIFTQPFFWGFFFVVLVFYSLLYPNRAVRNAYLFLVSLFFYYKTSGFYVVILLFSTLADFFIGKQIYKASVQRHRKWWVALSIFINLFILVYFKYAYFFTENFNALLGTDLTVYNHFAQWTNSFFGTHFRVDKILLPVGISFFTFQTISYSVDIYRGNLKPVNNILDFGFYVSFFPQLVAGPIVRASEFIPQLYKPYHLTKIQFGTAVFWVLNGLLKKMFLADYIAGNFIDRVFANPGSFSGFENLMALYGYSLQVYADFSGYTDIAIGVALLMGFHLPVNFNSPYKAISVGDFWRRWHISLSSWLKDYLYIPMGGNREGSFFSYFMMLVMIFFISILAGSWMVPIGFAVLIVLAALGMRYSPGIKNTIDTNINVLLTMLIGGLWHGASWNFVTWGGLNGLGLLVYKFWKPVSPWGDKKKWFNRFLGIFLTFNFITFTRTWFRGENEVLSRLMLSQIWNNFQPEVIPDVLAGFKSVFAVMVLGYIIHWLPSSFKQWYRTTFINLPFSLQTLAGFLTLFFIYQILSADLQPFIYFAF
ncbi:MAG: MBOAT family protein [Schleiferiaceae bacterium]|nr:MBOAT family protein [Schleiferiaceae bacterium]